MNTENLKAIRSKKGVTQKEAADALCISPNTYKNYEQGMREPNNEMLCKLADYFQVTTDYLLGRAPQADPMKLLVSQSDLSAEAQEALYLSLPEEARAIVLQVMRMMRENRRIKQTKAPAAITAARPS